MISVCRQQSSPQFSTVFPVVNNERRRYQQRHFSNTKSTPALARLSAHSSVLQARNCGSSEHEDGKHAEKIAKLDEQMDSQYKTSQTVSKSIQTPGSKRTNVSELRFQRSLHTTHSKKLRSKSINNTSYPQFVKCNVFISGASLECPEFTNNRSKGFRRVGQHRRLHFHWDPGTDPSKDRGDLHRRWDNVQRNISLPVDRKISGHTVGFNIGLYFNGKQDIREPTKCMTYWSKSNIFSI